MDGVTSSNKTIKKPAGLEPIAIVAIFASLLLAMPFGANVVFSSIFTTMPFINWILLFLGIYSFALAIVLLTQLSSKAVWYMGIAFWSLLFVFFALWFLGLFNAISFSWTEEARIVFFPAFVYVLLCLLYFQTRRVKEYFNVTNRLQNNPSNVVASN